MIIYLKGQVKAKNDNFIILLVNDIGYKIFVPNILLQELREGKEAELYLYHHHYETGVDLYGFKTQEELEFYEQLLKIGGIGPKSALGVLAIAPLGEIKKSIIHGDPELLIKVSGVGRKTAEKIVVELKDKVSVTKSLGRSGTIKGTGQVLEALITLGYSAFEARNALRKIDPAMESVEEKVKACLKVLGEK